MAVPYDQLQQMAGMIAMAVKEAFDVGDKGKQRVLGAPPEWDSGKEDQYQEWSVKLKA